MKCLMNTGAILINTIKLRMGKNGNENDEKNNPMVCADFVGSVKYL